MSGDAGCDQVNGGTGENNITDSETCDPAVSLVIRFATNEETPIPLNLAGLTASTTVALVPVDTQSSLGVPITIDANVWCYTIQDLSGSEPLEAKPARRRYLWVWRDPRWPASNQLRSDHYQWTQRRTDRFKPF